MIVFIEDKDINVVYGGCGALGSENFLCYADNNLPGTCLCCNPDRYGIFTESNARLNKDKLVFGISGAVVGLCFAFVHVLTRHTANKLKVSISSN